MTGAARVKVAGSGHSFTDIACTDGVMIDMSAMRRVLAVEGNEVTVEAGITLHDLGEELRARGLAMENQGDVDPQTLAGAISTATHGTGGRFGNLSSQVTGVRLVTGTGELVDLREGDELRAARVSLGALGRDLGAHAPLRARLHDPPHRRAAPARRACCRGWTSWWTRTTTGRRS